MFEIIVEKEGLELLGWRTVPTVPEVLGHKARECMPYIMQAFIKKPEDVEKGIAFDRRLYVVRRVFEQSNEHEPKLGESPSEPFHRTQRRDQHHPRKRRQDAGP